MPYLGKETEVESAVQARVLRQVLCGCYDVVRRKHLRTPERHQWVQDGLYVTLMADKEYRAKRKEADLTIVSDPEVRLLQVPIEPESRTRSVSYVEEGDEQVCYLLHDETRELLHLPPHVFDLLSTHSNDEHAADRVGYQLSLPNGIHVP